MTYDCLFAALRAWGADPVEGVARFADDADLYVRCLHSFACDASFELLYEALTQAQTAQAAHTLKGVAGNLSLTPLFELLSIMLAEIRRGTATQLPQQTQQTRALQAQLQALLSG